MLLFPAPTGSNCQGLSAELARIKFITLETWFKMHCPFPLWATERAAHAEGTSVG